MELFGHQVRLVADVLKAKSQPVNAGVSPAEAESRATLASQYARIVMQIVVSAVILIVSFTILAHNPPESMQKALFSLIGTVVGYWLR